MFDWINSTVEECAVHITKTSAQSTTSVYIYHERQGNVVMTDKIKKARELAKKYRILQKAEEIREEFSRS